MRWLHRQPHRLVGGRDADAPSPGPAPARCRAGRRVRPQHRHPPACPAQPLRGAILAGRPVDHVPRPDRTRAQAPVRRPRFEATASIPESEWIPLTDGRFSDDKPCCRRTATCSTSRRTATGSCVSGRNGWSRRPSSPLGPAFPVHHFHSTWRSIANVPLGWLGVSVAPRPHRLQPGRADRQHLDGHDRRATDRGAISSADRLGCGARRRRRGRRRGGGRSPPAPRARGDAAPRCGPAWRGPARAGRRARRR